MRHALVLAAALAGGCVTTYWEGNHVSVSAGADTGPRGDKVFVQPVIVERALILRALDVPASALELSQPLARSILEHGYGRFIYTKGMAQLVVYVTVKADAKMITVHAPPEDDTLIKIQKPTNFDFSAVPGALDCRDAAGAAVAPKTGEDLLRCAPVDRAVAADGVKRTP